VDGGTENDISPPAAGKPVGDTENSSGSNAGTISWDAGIRTISASGTRVGSGMKALPDVPLRLACGSSCIMLSVFITIPASHPEAA